MIEINSVHNEDCLITLDKDFHVDYVFTDPPEFDELGLDPIKDRDKYNEFLFSVFEKLIKKCNVMTVVGTDRKNSGVIVPKHYDIMQYFFSKNFDLIAHKIWYKRHKMNLFRLTFAHLLTFSNTKVKQNYPTVYRNDVFDYREKRFGGFIQGIALECAENCILNFTDEEQTVYDPFIGTGIVAKACIKNNRNFIGSEINPKTFELSLKRIKEERRKVDFQKSIGIK